ncbi:MAG TPA: hypothetical protein PLA46_05620, partial [Phycicoccus sp.]|nr:hypothetical protein [Phycicoccus sp.]
VDCPLPATFQDAGRPGYRQLGVPLSGALDPEWLAIANALVGNPAPTVALEMRLLGPKLRARTPLSIALAGEFSARIEDATGQSRPAANWCSHTLAAGDLLQIGSLRSAIGYLAVRGGFDLPVVLGSRSTYARAGLGGFDGRALRAGDKVKIGAPQGLPSVTGATGISVHLPDAPVLRAGPLRVIAGPQKRTRIMSANERKMTAYHEGGHAIVAAAMNHLDPVTKVTILPRGRALGYTMVMPIDDKYSTTRNEILDQLAYALGGRVAEEMIFHDPTTGASNDIEKATAMARKMVTEFGMSERVGAVKLGQSQGEVFLGRDMGHQRDYSERVASVVDEEVRRFIEAAHDEAWHVINDNRHILDALVLELLEKETLQAADIARIFEPLVKRPHRPQWLSGEHRSVSTLPPVLTPAERAALNGGSNGVGPTHLGEEIAERVITNPAGTPEGATPAPGDAGTADAIDAAAAAGAVSPEDSDAGKTQIVETPDGEGVDQDAR